MKKSPNISEEDSALFRKTVGSIKPIKQDSIVINKPKLSHTPSKTEEDDRAIMQELFDSEFERNLLERGDKLSYSKPGIQKQTLRKLRRGQYPIEAELDLHGMTVATANMALSRFLGQCIAHSQRCVRIIHGKGIGSKNKKPIIKNRLNNWLRHQDNVMAFCSARQTDGGTGAIYLLLKRN
jgi:DNA-nicking Smr family endonuclease